MTHPDNHESNRMRPTFSVPKETEKRSVLSLGIDGISSVLSLGIDGISQRD